MAVVTIGSFKGGVGKTTTAIHIAALLAQDGSTTMLVDGDPTRGATEWAKRQNGYDLPCEVIDQEQALYVSQRRQFDHIVFDTKARPEPEDFVALAKACDLLIIPTSPSIMDLNALTLTINALNGIPDAAPYRVLLTLVKRSSNSGAIARQLLDANGIPVFGSDVTNSEVFPTACAQGSTVEQVSGKLAQRCWEEYSAIHEEIRAICGLKEVVNA